MCGIGGIYEYQNQTVVDPLVLEAMQQVIQHRGPDDVGYYTDGNLGIFNRRLSIIDLPGGHQPIFNEDQSIVIVFNGEIYNYKELIPRLQEQGHQFKTVCDTEVIIHLYEEYGDACVDELRGMFAFALWDTRRRRLLIVRDRLGIKPLYYTLADNRLVFGSEIKAILEHPAITPRLDMDALGNFLSLKYVPAPQTMFAGIRALPPGHLMICDENGVNIRQYWDVSFAREGMRGETEETYAEQLEELLRDSVRLRLRADVPFGAFLSGGIDSSTIVALMSQFLNEPVKSFSVGFEGTGETFSELPYARIIAEKYQTDHHEVLINSQDLINLAEKVVWHLDQPIADEASLANYMVSSLASEHVKMVLTGEGGDELFAGYARYAGERLSPLFRLTPNVVKSMIWNISRYVPGMRRPKIALYALCQPTEISRLVSWFPLFNPEMKYALISDKVKRTLNGFSPEYVFGEHLARTDAKNPLNRMLYVDTKLWLPDDLLARGDKTSMAVSLEARIPFLDHKLVEFAATLPPHLKLNGLTRKYLLKKVSQKWLPPEIIHRKKQGFPMPIPVWFKDQARSFLRDHLSSTQVQRRGLFDWEYVEKLLTEHETGFADHGALLWGLLNVELWHRVFIDGVQTSAKPSDTTVAVVSSSESKA